MGNSDSDEADNSAHALIAALQSQVDQLKRGRETAYSAQNTEQVFCTNCKKPYHTKEQCWLPGGGIAHLSKEERRALLQAKKKRRTERAVSFATKNPQLKVHRLLRNSQRMISSVKSRTEKKNTVN